MVFWYLMILTRTNKTMWIWSQERIGSFICGAMVLFSFSIFFLLFLITITVCVHYDNSHHYDFSSSQAGERLMVEENTVFGIRATSSCYYKRAEVHEIHLQDLCL